MFSFLRGKPPKLRLEGRLVALREPGLADYAEWRRLREESRAFLAPWEPRWSPDELSLRSFRARLRQWESDAEAGAGRTLFIEERASGSLAGGISIVNIRYGAAESGEIGYWMGERFAGLGYMSEAILLLTPWCFQTLGLHRIVAACIPDNRRSRRVLEKAGFEREGLVRSYLRIDGVRRDHLLYSLIAPEGADLNTRG